MNSRASTHPSADDINDYLLGNPAVAVRTAVEEHCLQCPECLEDMYSLTARIDKFQLAHVSPLISSIPGSHVPSVPQRQPLLDLQGRAWQGWASRVVAASLVLMVVPDSIRFVGLDHLLNSQLTTTALDLPFTREYPSSLALIAMPRLELEQEYPPPEMLISEWPKPHRQFRPPQQRTRKSDLVQVALIDAPDLNFTEYSIDPLPKEIEITPAAAARSRPHILRRLLSAVAAPFRSPRN
jgi:hypothetical protein